MNLLLRFWPAQRGEISFGDVSLDDLAQRDVRRHIALLDQDATLFAGSIRDNLLLARPGAATEDLSRVVRLGRLDEWVATLPKGLDTPVGEGGIQVSGGQRQRIGLTASPYSPTPRSSSSTSRRPVSTSPPPTPSWPTSSPPAASAACWWSATATATSWDSTRSWSLTAVG